MDPNSTKEIMQMIRSLSASTSDSVKTFSFGQWTPAPTKVPANKILRSITNSNPVTKTKSNSDGIYILIWYFIIIIILIIVFSLIEKTKEKRKKELEKQQLREQQAREQERIARLEELQKLREIEEKKRREAIAKAGTYSTGYEYEEYVAARLEIDGWTNITVTRKSGDYGVDIIATSPDGNKCAIQCKMFQGKVGFNAVKEVFMGKTIYGCSHAIVITTSTFTPQAIDGAKRTGVQLISNYR